MQCSIIEFCQIAACISASAPTHHLGISRVDEGSMKEFVRTVRQTDSTFAYVHSVEINPRQTMVHCHGYYHTASGLAVPTEVIDHARRKAGFGTFKQGKIRSNVKTRFFAYPGKTLATPLGPQFLDLNGQPGHRKLVHATSGFWRDGATGPTMSRAKLHSTLRRRRAGATIHQTSLAEIAQRIREAS